MSIDEEVITPNSNPSTLELADILKQYKELFLTDRKLSKRQLTVIGHIMHCRTSAYGYHVDSCNRCGHSEQEFNSCRDRHCPKCQGISRKKWTNARLQDLLAVPYYHIVFTLPHFLNDLIAYNKTFFYELLFSESSKTLMTFGRDSKWMGGEIGFYGVLHTWGQTLWPHVHVHFIVAGGALSNDGQWIASKCDDKFLFPVRALSKVFRGKFIQKLKKAFYQNELSIPPQLLSLFSSTEAFEHWIDNLVNRNWVVYCKSPFPDADQVVGYIGRYTHSVAISNQRILDIQNGSVRFLYKDYKHSRVKWRQMSLKATEFIRRFVWHVLPKGFHKIRHYGFLSNGRSKRMIERIRVILGRRSAEISKHNDWWQSCPKCGQGQMIPFFVINRIGRIVFNRFLLAKNTVAYDTS